MPAARPAAGPARPAPRSAASTWRLGIAALTLAIAASGAVGIGAPAPVHAATDRVSGIDIASWQHPGGRAIDWSRVANAGHAFAVIKATESTTYTNPYFAADRDGARANGLVIGAYHFARPSRPIRRDARAEARHFVRVTGRQHLARTLPPVLDLESTGDLRPRALSRWTRTFLAATRSLTGRTPMIYSYDSFLRTRLRNVGQFRGYPLWLATYQRQAPTNLPGSWAGWRLWQHTSRGNVPGIRGDVDLNWFDGSRAELNRFATGRVPTRVAQAVTVPREPTQVAGRVDPSYAGERVVRMKRVRDRWVPQWSTLVSDDGTFRFLVNPRARGRHDYRVRLHAQSPYARVRSATVSVTVVAPRITAGLAGRGKARTAMRRGDSRRIDGRVDRFYAGESVVRLKRTRSGWQRQSVARVDATGRYAFRVRPDAVGAARYRVRLMASEPKARATSRTLVVAVRPR